MESAFLSSIGEASRQMEAYQQITDYFLVGLVFTVLCVLTARFTFRAWLFSFMGKKNGVFVSTICEAFAMVFYVVTAYQDPKIILGSLVWGAVIYKAFIYGI
ncbi:hypothetical protein ACOBQJ_03215 [Pelotomaculum propionicicum]|uniref:hypothetical protein n=1 Tax=Pelotomaculum propionicicum TaxID=258475 RepID=UPI003B825AA1